MDSWQVHDSEQGLSGDILFVKGANTTSFDIPIGASYTDKGMRNDQHDAFGVTLVIPCRIPCDTCRIPCDAFLGPSKREQLSKDVALLSGSGSAYQPADEEGPRGLSPLLSAGSASQPAAQKEAYQSRSPSSPVDSASQSADEQGPGGFSSFSPAGSASQPAAQKEAYQSRSAFSSVDSACQSLDEERPGGSLASESAAGRIEFRDLEWLLDPAVADAKAGFTKSLHAVAVLSEEEAKVLRRSNWSRSRNLHE